jgi:dephospho-CoA kinase
MLRVGLTGGIASGKTTVAGMMRALGCVLIELDPIAHALIEPGHAAYEQIVKEFGGEAILNNERHIDRAKLGAIVFADAARLQRLNQIVHPPVLQVLDNWFASLADSGAAELGVVEAALLVEAGYHTKLDRLVVCWCRPEQQLERLAARGLTREQAQQRIASQMPADEKRKLATDVIDCSGSVEQTQEQTARVVDGLRKLAGATAATRV